MKKKSKIVSKRGQYTKEATKKACKKVAEMETCGKFSKHHYKSQSVCCQQEQKLKKFQPGVTILDAIEESIGRRMGDDANRDSCESVENAEFESSEVHITHTPGYSLPEDPYHKNNAKPTNCDINQYSEPIEEAGTVQHLSQQSPTFTWTQLLQRPRRPTLGTAVPLPGQETFSQEKTVIVPSLHQGRGHSV